MSLNKPCAYRRLHDKVNIINERKRIRKLWGGLSVSLPVFLLK